MQSEGTHLAKVRAHERLIHRDNAFGTPEEDAFRRDFTINALFYDIASFSIIDYVGGLKDLESGLIRSIGDPGVRFLEDPVRMLRAVVFAARLDFEIDQPILEAFETHRHEIGQRGAAAADRGVLQDPAIGIRGEEFPAAEGDGAAARDHPGARRGRTGVLGSRSRAWIATASASRRRPTA